MLKTARASSQNGTPDCRAASVREDFVFKNEALPSIPFNVVAEIDPHSSMITEQCSQTKERVTALTNLFESVALRALVSLAVGVLVFGAFSTIPALAIPAGALQTTLDFAIPIISAIAAFFIPRSSSKASSS